MKRVAAFLVLLAGFAACKEEYTQHDLHILNPTSESNPTDPADDDDDAVDAPVDATADATTDAKADAKPADAKADARDGGAG